MKFIKTLQKMLNQDLILQTKSYKCHFLKASPRKLSM